MNGLLVVRNLVLLRMLQEKFIGIKSKAEGILAIGVTASKVNMIDKKFLDESENLSDDCFEEKLVHNFTKKEMEFSIEEYWIEQVAEINPDAIVLEPRSTFNRAIIGMDMDGKLVYSATRIVKAFVDEDGMTEEEAIEFFEYNTLGAIKPMNNPNKPLFVYDEFVF